MMERTKHTCGFFWFFFGIVTCTYVRGPFVFADNIWKTCGLMAGWTDGRPED